MRQAGIFQTASNILVFHLIIITIWNYFQSYLIIIGRDAASSYPIHYGYDKSKCYILRKGILHTLWDFRAFTKIYSHQVFHNEIMKRQ